MIEAGIIDPTRVVRTALRIAGSVAGMLVMTAAAVAEHVDGPPVPPAALASAY